MLYQRKEEILALQKENSELKQQLEQLQRRSNKKAEAMEIATLRKKLEDSKILNHRLVQRIQELVAAYEDQIQALQKKIIWMWY